MKHLRCSPAEAVLFILLFLCYLTDLYFLYAGHRVGWLVFFVIYSCIGLLLAFLEVTGRKARNAAGQELSYEKSVLDELVKEKKRELEKAGVALKQKTQLAELLSGELKKEKAEAASLYGQLHEVMKRLSEYELLFPDRASGGPGLYQLLPPEAAEPDAVCRDVVKLLSGALEPLRARALDAGVIIRISASSCAAPVNAAPSLLRIMFYNIAENSVKYMRRPGNLIITLSAAGESLFIVFRDDGEGLGESETKRIFELNYQGQNRLGGSGLGLAQAKAIVCFCGGDIRAKSGAGKGMAIYLSLPLAERRENAV